ncbi:MAG TPA: nuclear transport factor 2 family protein [Gaiellaceae bacterium]|nr:nuclear transport factor 2 family protein [Gaiellaceae bacterium]
MTATAAELTFRLVDAYNRRDRDAMHALLAEGIDYRRPGEPPLRAPDDVIARYERDWASYPDSRVEVRGLVESGEDVMAEITMHRALEGRPSTREAAVAHRWHGGRLVRYRQYTDAPAFRGDADRP